MSKNFTTLSILLGKNSEDLEQIFVNCSKCFIDCSFNTHSLTLPHDTINNILPNSIQKNFLKDFGRWDPIIGWKIKNIIKEIEPDIIFVFGKRASSAFEKISIKIPIIAICHDYTVKNAQIFHYFISINKSIKSLLIKNSCIESNIFIIPSILYLSENIIATEKIFRKPPIIGTIGKFISNKGFKIFVQSLDILRSMDIKFSAKVVVNSTEEEKFRLIASEFMLEDILEFVEPTPSRSVFFDSIDIFCSPSLHPQNPIILLESYTHSTPVIATSVEGYIDMVELEKNCLLFAETGEANSLAQTIKILIQDPKIATTTIKNGLKTIEKYYTASALKTQMLQVLEKIVVPNK